MAAITVSMINWKGGVGKTTLTLHIGLGLNQFHNKRVLLVDLDPQCSMSFLGLGVERYINLVYGESGATIKTMFDYYFSDSEADAKDIIQKELVTKSPYNKYKYVDIILSHQELVLLDLRLARSRKAGRDHKEETRFEIEKLSILQKLLDQVKNDYDYILLDCPPNVNLVTQNAFYASDYYVVPAIPDFLSTTGISLIKEYMEGFNRDFNGMHAYADYGRDYTPTKFGGIVFNMVDEYGGRPKQTHFDTISSINSQHPGFVFNEYVTDGDGISVAASLSLPVFANQYFTRSNQNAQKQADYLASVVNEFLVRVK